MAQTSTEKLEDSGPAEKEKVTSVPQRAAVTYDRVAFAKMKTNGAVCPKDQVVRCERVKMSGSMER